MTKASVRSAPSVACKSKRPKRHRIAGKVGAMSSIKEASGKGVPFMNPTGFVKHAAALIALALCSACAGGSAVAPASGNSAVQYVGRTASVNGRLVTAARPNPHGAQYRTIVSELTGNAKSKYFEYIINFYGSYAGIFHYPIKDSETGELNDVGGQGCTNVLHGYGRRTIWIMAAYNDMTEYVVPHKPIETLPAVSDGSM